MMMMMPAIPAADWDAARVSSSLYSKFSADDQNIFILWINMIKRAIFRPIWLEFDQKYFCLLINMIGRTIPWSIWSASYGSTSTWQGDHPSTASQLRIAPPDYDQIIFLFDQNNEIDKRHDSKWVTTRIWSLIRWTNDCIRISSHLIFVNFGTPSLSRPLKVHPKARKFASK